MWKSSLILISFFSSVLSLELPRLDYKETDWPETCKGNEQSPIDFPSNKSFYTPLNDTEILFSTYIPVSNVKFEVLPDAKFSVKMPEMGDLYFRKNGFVYKYILNEIHFHINAEHTFDGKKFDLEMHMVHSKDNEFFSISNDYVTEDQDERNQKLVVGILFRVTDEENIFIDKLKVGSNQTVSDFRLNDFVKKDRFFYHYEGSLTTPPCTETVNWVVMTEIEELSQSQLDQFIELIQVQNGYQKGNNRKIQSLNGRQIYYQDINSRYHRNHDY